jgi:hypothetical protein
VISVNQIYRKDDFIIVPFFKGKKREFMVINLRKKDRMGFKNAHSHLRSYDMCVYLINLARKKRVNGSLSRYLLASLIRISDDDQYCEKLSDILEVKANKSGSTHYRNRAK